MTAHQTQPPDFAIPARTRLADIEGPAQWPMQKNAIEDAKAVFRAAVAKALHRFLIDVDADTDQVTAVTRILNDAMHDVIGDATGPQLRECEVAWGEGW
jgi:hypothetical protein